MRETEQTKSVVKKETEGTPVPPEKDKGQEAPAAAQKPKRGRKTRAEAKREEPVKAPETAGEKVSDTTEAAPGTAWEEQAETPPAAAHKAGTDPQNNAVENDAAGSGNALDGAVKTGDAPGDSGKGLDEKEENPFMPAPLPAVSAQAIETPLKRMKQEFHNRAQIIKEQMRNIQNAFITIGFQLHWIRENNMYRVQGYKSIYDYAEKEYGIKRTTCCNFICIIENYAERDENGEVVESIAGCYRNYSASQLVAMLGMPEEVKAQVTPDMSVRAINRLRKGEPEAPSVVEAAPARTEDSAPVKEEEKPSFAGNAAPDHGAQAEESAETAKTQEADRTEEESDEPPADDTVSRGAPEAAGTAEKAAESTKQTEEKALESTEAAEPTADGDPAVKQPDDDTRSGGDTLAEIDSYSDYRSMADKLDIMIKHVFSAKVPVRVKIVCVQG